MNAHTRPYAPWLAHLVQQGKTKPFAVIADVTPEMATDLLAHNVGNRPVVARYKKLLQAFKEDKFVFNGESIIVSNDGLINDGQHRLMACVDSNKPFKTVLVFGVPREARLTNDTGTNKNRATLVGMYGVPNHNQFTAILAVYLTYEAGIYHHSAEITTEEILDAWEKHKRRLERASFITGSSVARSLNVTALTAGYLILHQLNPLGADQFFRRVVDGTGLEQGSPILMLRNRLMSDKTAGIRRNHERLELILRYWNAWRLDRTIQRQIPLLGAYPADVEE